MKFSAKLILLSTFVFLVASFQNCSENKVTFEESSIGKLGVCNGISCDLDPLTDRPAVTTILLALGDHENSQLVVLGASSQLIAEMAVRYSSPKKNPRILLVQDKQTNNEDLEDTEFVRDVLLRRYNVSYIREPNGGLNDADVAGYDLIWFNNPGHPMSSVQTRDVLLRFKGGVILQGDDLSAGRDFSLESLTGLKFIDNGSTVRCNGQNYAHDNNSGHQYHVQLDAAKIPGVDNSTIVFRYGNDIDLTRVSDFAKDKLEVIAWAKGGPTVCTEQRPTIVRYKK